MLQKLAVFLIGFKFDPFTVWKSWLAKWLHLFNKQMKVLAMLSMADVGLQHMAGGTSQIAYGSSHKIATPFHHGAAMIAI